MSDERIQKILSQAGIASRRKAEVLVSEGKVKINGKTAILGQKASFSDEITVNGNPIKKQTHAYYILNKPVRTISSVKDEKNRTTVIDLIDDSRQLFPIGRLDFNTTGLLLITNDGELTNKLLHPKYEITRKYKARIDEALSKEDLEFLNSKKVYIDGVRSKQIVRHIDKKLYEVILQEGKNHHVKKIFNSIDRKVLSLHRFEFAGLLLTKLPKGAYRPLNSKEIRWLKQLSSNK
ncbi:MAG: rRNA pseudouridine synthase [Mycoplasma sp.]|nr:rRNA pseudouridine synthase [Mycoplasma sp.]